MYRIQGIKNPVGITLQVTRLAGWLLCAAVLLWLAPTAKANSVVFATGVQTLGAFTENVTATFDIGTNSITVHLLNLIVDPKNVDQALGSVRFTITGAGTPTPIGTTPTGISDTRLEIDRNGNPKSVAGETTTAWRTSVPASVSGSWEQIALCAVCAAGGTNGLIIGGPNRLTSSGKYASADTTLTAGSTAQWIIGSGLIYTGGPFKGKDTSPDFTINFSAGTNLAKVVITNVIFGFGEDANYGGDSNSITLPRDTPEPDSVILFGTGVSLVAIAAGVRRLRHP